MAPTACDTKEVALKATELRIMAGLIRDWAYHESLKSSENSTSF